MTGLIRSELLKVRTTNVWWALLLGLLVLAGLALALDLAIALQTLGGNPDLQGGVPAEPAAVVASVYTAGQILATLVPMVLGGLVATNDYFHQTATPTFLAAPRRIQVVLAKLVCAALWGSAFGLVVLVMNVTVGALVLAAQGYDTYLGQSETLGGVLLYLLSYAIWAVFGFGIGTLLKNQIATVVVLVVLKLIGETLVVGVLTFLAERFDQDWIQKLVFALPSILSSVMVTVTKAEGAPHWYTAAAIMVGYGLLSAGIGGLLTLRRDIT